MPYSAFNSTRHETVRIGLQAEADWDSACLAVTGNGTSFTVAISPDDLRTLRALIDEALATLASEEAA